jgi:hypothetical protein
MIKGPLLKNYRDWQSISYLLLLPALHQDYKNKIDARLNEKSLPAYMRRVFLLGLIHPRWRSQSLTKPMIKD